MLKILTGPEGAADYCQMLMSFENAPSIIVIDFAPMVAKYIAPIQPSFLSPHNGGILPNTPENIQRVLDGEQIPIPGLLNGESNDRYVLIDPFHRHNHHQPEAALHDPSAVLELKTIRANMAIQEQRNALTKKFGHFLNSMSPDRFVKYVMYITCMENVKLNQQNKLKLKKLLRTNIYFCEETSKFITEKTKQSNSATRDNHTNRPTRTDSKASESSKDEAGRKPTNSKTSGTPPSKSRQEPDSKASESSKDEADRKSTNSKSSRTPPSKSLQEPDSKASESSKDETDRKSTNSKSSGAPPSNSRQEPDSKASESSKDEADRKSTNSKSSGTPPSKSRQEPDSEASESSKNEADRKPTNSKSSGTPPSKSRQEPDSKASESSKDEADRKSTNSKSSETPPSKSRQEPDSKASESSKDEADRKSTNSKTLLQNREGANVCWLNSISYLLASVGLHRTISEYLSSLDDLQNGLTNIMLDYFKMLSNAPHVYNKNVHMVFAEACLEELRGLKKQPQDVVEVLIGVIFPLLEQSFVLFDPSMAYIHQKARQDLLEERLCFAEECGEKLEFVFAVPVREQSSSSSSGLDCSSIDSIRDLISVTARSASDSKIKFTSTYRLVSFISFYGPIHMGHYVTYVYNQDSAEYLMFDGLTVRKTSKDEFLNHAKKTSQLVLYRLETRNAELAAPPRKKRRTCERDPDTPFVDLSGVPDDMGGPSRVWLYADSSTGRLELHQTESVIMSNNTAELNGAIINSFSSMLVTLYRNRRNAAVSYMDTVRRVKGIIPPLEGPFIQVINMHQNHWVLFSNLGQKDHDCVLIFDSNYSRGKCSVVSDEYVDITDYDHSLMSITKQLKPNATTFKIVDIEQQRDVVNCGVHALFNAWSIIALRKLYKSTVDINHIRSQIRLSFTNNRVQNLAHYSADSVSLDEMPLLKVISCD